MVRQCGLGITQYHIFVVTKLGRGDNTRIAVLQLDGKTSGGAKNLPKEQIPLLEDFLKSLGYTVKHLEFKNSEGHYVPMRQWVETLASAEIFFGVCSGGLHMAHCVGIPRIVFTNDYAHSILDQKKAHIEMRLLCILKIFTT